MRPDRPLSSEIPAEFDLATDRGDQPAILIASNLALGITFSTVAANQMQATQLAQFTLLPSRHAVRLHVSIPRDAGLGTSDHDSGGFP